MKKNWSKDSQYYLFSCESKDGNIIASRYQIACANRYSLYPTIVHLNIDLTDKVLDEVYVSSETKYNHLV